MEKNTLEETTPLLKELFLSHIQQFTLSIKLEFIDSDSVGDII
jgi:hypothetical protein